MLFEGFVRDVFESWSDVGVVYIRNKYGWVVLLFGFLIGCKNSNFFKNNVFKGIGFLFFIFVNGNDFFYFCI